METPNPNTPSVNLLKTIREFLSEDEAVRSTTEIAQNLGRQGIDFEKMLKEVRKQAERAENRLRLQTLASDIKDSARRPVERAVASLAELKEMVSAQISSLGTGASVTAFYRKLETAEEEDLLSLLDDFEELKRQAEDERAPGDKQN